MLGVHEVVFAPVTEEQARGALRFAKLGFEIVLSSFQVLRLGTGATSFDLGPFSPEAGGLQSSSGAATEWDVTMGFGSLIPHKILT